MGLPLDARHVAVPERPLRLVPGGLPLRRRDFRAPGVTRIAAATTAPHTGAAFTFWHPDLVTLHVWLWYPNPDGLFASYNPLVRPFNG